MKISQLIRLLEAILREHGDIQVRCGTYRIAGISVLHNPVSRAAETAVLMPRTMQPF
jgi:hypothetical protein